jgi:hypothetical protein
MEIQLLKTLFPDLADELEKLLLDDGLQDLAEQIHNLSVYDRCRCGDNFCSTFYTLPRTGGAWGPKHENIELPAKSGMIILDVVDGKIAAVEILYRDDF